LGNWGNVTNRGVKILNGSQLILHMFQGRHCSHGIEHSNITYTLRSVICHFPRSSFEETMKAVQLKIVTHMSSI